MFNFRRSSRFCGHVCFHLDHKKRLRPEQAHPSTCSDAPGADMARLGRDVAAGRIAGDQFPGVYELSAGFPVAGFGSASAQRG